MNISKMENILKQYSKVTEPEYAIMISGSWGIGKTFFVKNFFEALSPPCKMIYVSLYGITDKCQIDDQIFSSLIGNVSAKDSEIKNAADLVGRAFSVLGDKAEGSAIGALASTVGTAIKSRALKNIGKVHILFNFDRHYH